MDNIDTSKFPQQDDWNKIITEPKEVRQAWFEENKHKVTNLSVQDACYALTKGPGFCLFTDVLDQKDIDDANAYLHADVARQETMDGQALTEDVGHSNIYSNNNAGKTNTLGKRVWNLTNKGECFERMVQQETIMEVVGAVLGNDFCLGSFAANVLCLGAGRQSPHLDYPYWDYTNK